MTRDSSFSYRCKACSRCCVNKRIQTNPYEVLRLARNLGLTTGEFARRYLEKQGPYLRVTAEGVCIFLENQTCAVYADRPLACRTYPLGRWVSEEMEETFRELKPHPESEGVYGRDGTVGQYLVQQGARPYLEAADRYQALFYRLFDALQRVLPIDPELPGKAKAAMIVREDMPASMKWLDVDGVVERYCTEHGLALPHEITAVVNLHIQAIDQGLGG